MDYSINLQNFTKQNNLNNNIYNRNIPSSNLQTHFSPRSVSTKYSQFPILDHRKESNVLLNYAEPFNSENTFYPGNRKPHFCGFARNIDLESNLRNQFFALQKADQAKYIPSSESSLYNNNVNFINVNSDLDSILLFKKENFNDFNPNLSNNIGNEIFLNSTRVQLKDLK